jgi:hypothetical protein
MFPRVDNGLIRHRHLGVKVRVVNPLPRGKLNVGLRLPRRFHCCRPLHAQTRGRCPGVGAQGSVPRGRCPGVGAQGSVPSMVAECETLRFVTAIGSHRASAVRGGFLSVPNIYQSSDSDNSWGRRPGVGSY